MLLAAAAVNAQKAAKCELTRDKSPTVRGLKLGMTDVEAGAVLNKPFEPVIFKPYIMQASAFIPNGLGRTKNEEDFVSVEIFDGRVSRISVNYGGVNWRSDREFVENFSPKLGLPTDAWTFEIYQGGLMECRDFSIRLSSDVISNLTLVDREAERAIAERKRRDAEQAKKAIKP